MSNRLLASSLNNFVMIANSHAVVKPYVTFSVGSPTTVYITVKDAINSDGYNRVLTGSTSSTISSFSFNTGGNAAIGLFECLKLNDIFYDLTLVSANTIKAFIDSSHQYSITVSGGGITVGGTYSTYNYASINKTVLMLQGSVNGLQKTISMEKYSNGDSVSFNITSPFEHYPNFVPISMNVTAYQVYNDIASLVTVPYDSITVLPTSLSKFESVDYSKYYGVGKRYWLTNMFERPYNYGEHYALSVLSDSPVTIKKNYYTNSGMFLESSATAEYIEHNGIRYDIYDSFDLSNVEARYNHQVGYVDVYAMTGSTEITYPVRFNVVPTCKENNEIFFVNAIGGIDSFNFNGESRVDRKIKDSTTFFVNNVKDWSQRLELEYVSSKRNEITHTVTTHQIDKTTAEWLNELARSRYTYKFLGVVNPKYKMLVIDKFDVDTNSEDDMFILSLEYHDADNSLKVY